MFSLRLLGGFALDGAAKPRALAYDKGRALLAYLATESGVAHSRLFLASMFWPELPQGAALTNLRQILHDLRGVFGAEHEGISPLQASRESVRLLPDASITVDALRFSAPVPSCPPAMAPPDCSLCLAQMAYLADEYRGEFMAGFSLSGCPEFDEWLQVRREAYHLHALSRLARLSACHERLKAYADALPFALRFLELEPWNEEGLQRTIRLFTLNGQRDVALAQYETSSRLLMKELGVLPSETTQDLIRLIRQGCLTHRVEKTDFAIPAPEAPPGCAGRRQVTVLYCELSCQSAALDCDASLALLQAPLRRCREIIDRFSGYVVPVHGGSLLAYFGYPLARETAAWMAAQSALSIARETFPEVEQRIGMHTGIVIGGGELQVPDAIGSTSGTAIGLRHFASRGSVVISEATRRLTGGFFNYAPLGEQMVTGTSTPVAAYRIIGESGARSRLEAASELTPLIGRHKEIDHLLHAWQQAKRGIKRACLITGDAGIGKSRLIHAVKQALSGTRCKIRELRCAPEYHRSPFHPLAALLESAMGCSAADSLPQRFDKLVAYVDSRFSPPEPDAVSLLAAVLMLPVSPPYRPTENISEQQRTKILSLLLALFESLAAEQPVLLIMEDLHWADPSSLEFLDSVLASKQTALFVLLSARPEFSPPWTSDVVETMPVRALNSAETSELVYTLAPGMAPEAVRRIVDRADGIPLFAEELALDALMSRAATETAIPSTLHDLLAARLDNLGTGKIIAQWAATAGREFNVELLRQIASVDENTLRQTLKLLQKSGLLQATSAESYRFRHALIQDTAYRSQTRKEREATHRRIARALTTMETKVRPEILARHWDLAGETLLAIECWTRAGHLAARHSANREATLHFRSALALVDALPASPEKNQREFALRIDLGTVMYATQGYASADGAAEFSRAMSIPFNADDEAETFRAAWGLWAGTSSRAGYAQAREIALQLLSKADRSGDPIYQQQAHFAVGDTLFWQGEFVAARQQLALVESLYQPAQHELHIAEFGEDCGITSDAYTSWILWFLGYPAQASSVSKRSVATARQTGHPFSLAYALTFAALLHAHMRLPGQALALARETQTLSDKHGFVLWQIGAVLARGWALAQQGKDEGIALIEQCLGATRSAMGSVTLTVMGPLAEANSLLGHLGAASRICDEALQIGESIGDHHIEAELLRLKGETLLAANRSDEALASFSQALCVARRQQAKSLELRAAISQSRQLRNLGRHDEARHLLESTLAWFSEGFNTPDLRQARHTLLAGS